MKKKQKKDFIEIAIENMYFYLKDKFNFDDIQAVMAIISILGIPITYFLGFTLKLSDFILIFYILIVFFGLTIIYTVIKVNYFKNLKINFIKDFQKKIEKDKKILIKNIIEVNNLNHHEFEIFAKEFFIKKGYFSWNTQRSHDFGADVIVEKNNQRTVIQVKHYKKNLDGYSIYQAKKARDHYKAEKGILFTNSDLTANAYKEANTENIIIINGHDISKYLRENGPIEIKNS